jgi:hypothetical protein
VTERKGRGRPPKDQKRAHLNLRVSPQMREVLVALAERYGRSLTQQVELMLELEVRRTDGVFQVWGDRWRETAPDDLGAKLDRILAAFAALRADVQELKLRRAREWQAEGHGTAADPVEVPGQITGEQRERALGGTDDDGPAATENPAAADRVVSRSGRGSLQLALDGLIRQAAELRDGQDGTIDEPVVPTKSPQVKSKR